MLITRSRSHTLDINVDLDRDVDYSDFMDHLQPQLDIILPEASRWRSVSYYGSFWGDVFVFFQHLSSLSAPRLEEFEVVVDSKGEEEYTENPLRVFEGGAPILSRVKVDGIQVTSCLPPVSSLTSLHLLNPPEVIDLNPYQEILTSSSTLTNIELDGEVVDKWLLHELVETHQCLQLSSVRSLSIAAEMSPQFQLYSLLYTLNCPDLQSLMITAVPPCYNIQESVRRQGHQLRTYTSLRSLELRFVDCSKLGPDFNVTLLPALTHITFVSCLSTTALLGILLPDKEDEGKDNDLWPLLQVIRFESFNWRDFDGLCEVISYRLRCNRPIARVEFSRTSLQWIPIDKLRETVCVECF